jgi:hypothetical protein
VTLAPRRVRVTLRELLGAICEWAEIIFNDAK